MKTQHPNNPKNAIPGTTYVGVAIWTAICSIGIVIAIFATAVL